jgi:hypothetical protein
MVLVFLLGLCSVPALATPELLNVFVSNITDLTPAPCSSPGPQLAPGGYTACLGGGPFGVHEGSLLFATQSRQCPPACLASRVGCAHSIVQYTCLTTPTAVNHAFNCCPCQVAAGRTFRSQLMTCSSCLPGELRVSAFSNCEFGRCGFTTPCTFIGFNPCGSCASCHVCLCVPACGNVAATNIYVFESTNLCTSPLVLSPLVGPAVVGSPAGSFTIAISLAAPEVNAHGATPPACALLAVLAVLADRVVEPKEPPGGRP